MGSPSSSSSGTVPSLGAAPGEITQSTAGWDQSPAHHWLESDAGIPIPIPSTSQAEERARVRVPPECANSIESQKSLDSQTGAFTAPSSWRTVQTPSSWGGSSYLVNDDAIAMLEDDEDEEFGRAVLASEGQPVAGMSYGQRQKLLRKVSKSKVKLSVARRASRFNIHAARGRWTQKLEDFRTLEVGYLTSRLPYKAAAGTTLAAVLFCFSPFAPASIKAAGLSAVVGVGMSLETNVGLTLQKGCNLIVGSSLAAVCACAVTELAQYTGSWRPYYLVGCVFLGAFATRRITLPGIVKTRWEQTLTFYLSIFHVLILSQTTPGTSSAVTFFTIFVLYMVGLVISLILTLFVKPEYAGDSLVALLVSDFHTAGVVLERIVEDYKSGTVLTKIQEILSGVVTEDHIHHDLQYIMKSTEQARTLINAAQWEPNRGFFFVGYPWDLYATLLDMLVHVMHDLIALDAALRAEIQAPLEIREFFAEDMEIVARECSLLFHKIGEAFSEHKKIDYHTYAYRTRLATMNLSRKLSRHSETLIAQDYGPQPPSRPLTRASSLASAKEDLDEVPLPENRAPTPPPSPPNKCSIVEQDFEVGQRLNMDEDDWLKMYLPRQESITKHWEETQQQISSLSFIKFASILIEIMGKIRGVVSMVDKISANARFSSVTRK